MIMAINTTETEETTPNSPLPSSTAQSQPVADRAKPAAITAREAKAQAFSENRSQRKPMRIFEIIPPTMNMVVSRVGLVRS